ncbi:beta/gamma crystallin-related protein [Piscinibacter sakaiensis]|uniref:beta/gamma crystallin-related protein n=1 Tax=Piscinibacter sakaiensis TaxID=1547922 RepID=UPI0037282B1F
MTTSPATPVRGAGRRGLIALATALVALPAAAQLTVYERDGYAGQALTADRPVPDLQRQRFDNRAASAVVRGGAWEVCEDPGFRGRCVRLEPGSYASLASTGLSRRVSSLRPAADLPPAAPAAERIRFFDGERFSGATFSTDQTLTQLQRHGFDDRASSVVVDGGTWELCSDARFGGRCVSFSPGEYPSLAAVGLDRRVSSVRKVAAEAPVAVDTPAVRFFESEYARGASFVADGALPNLERAGFGGRAASAEVRAGRWEVCEDPRWGGGCAILSPGRYPTVASMGLSDRVASVREAVDEVVASPVYDPRRRPQERLYQARVLEVREVRDGPQRRRAAPERRRRGGRRRDRRHPGPPDRRRQRA